MRIIYESDDGRSFLSKEECEDHEKRNKLHNFVKDNIETCYDSDAGFGIIEVHNVVDFVRKNIGQLFQLVKEE